MTVILQFVNVKMGKTTNLLILCKKIMTALDLPLRSCPWLLLLFL